MAMTPMMVQYLEFRKKYKDCILFFRIGDFYELFYDQAQLCSRELELTLTGKDCGQEERAPMCGIPFHSVNSYIPRLIAKGYKVAICEQVEDPKKADGLVKRDVIKVITPGTITEEAMLDEKKNNYIASIVFSKNEYGFAYSDISTGEFNITKVTGIDADTKVMNELSRINPSELVLPEIIYNNTEYIDQINRKFNIYISKYDNFSESEETKKLSSSVEGVEKSTLDLLFNYISETQKSSVSHINKINKYSVEKFMQLDISTRRNLEILESNREKTKKGSLLWVLDDTVTSMGGRLLRKWLEAPLLSKTDIVKRQDLVGVFKDDIIARNEVRQILKSVYDIERILSKVICGNVNPRDLLSFKTSLQKLPDLKHTLKNILDKSNDKYLSEIYQNFDELTDIYDLLEKSIDDDAPMVLKDGGVIKLGYNSQVDEYREATTKGQNWLMEIEAKEKELTKIKNLKVGYNKVYGFYIEVTNSYKSMVPQDRYIRKQTLTGSERYITEELKQIEEKILGAKEKLVDLEYKLFCDIREKLAIHVVRIQKTAQAIATLDCICSLAQVAEDNNYVKPEIVETGEINIKDGRHPVVEKALKSNPFIPNDTYLNQDDDRFLIITGPNMAGKSTYMRQVALIVYMAQIGSFVPAQSCKVSIVDRIFTRVGASDDLAMGESTFMVEMTELANILQNATSSSLIILDEIGRGTSTYDGLAIAWATVEYIANKSKIGAKTLFATHYHELTELEKKLEGVKNYSIAVSQRGDDVIFLRKIIRGGADESFGIYVAKLAGVSNMVIDRAKDILKYLEDVDLAKKTIKEKKKASTQDIQVDMFNYKMVEIAKILDKTNLDEMSPKEAMDVLYKLKEKLK